MITIPHTPTPWNLILSDPKSNQPKITIRFPGYDGTANGRPKAIDPFVLATVNTEYFNPHLKEPLANAHIMTIAPKLLEAFQLLHAHYQDLGKSNPGFMGKLALQDYGLWNQALSASTQLEKELNAIAKSIR